jgi:hypothetical protein
MIPLKVMADDRTELGYAAELPAKYELLRIWLETDVGEAGDHYATQWLWREIWRHRLGEIPEVEAGSDVCIVTVRDDVVTIDPGVLRFYQPLVLPLLEWADATERWLDVVNPEEGKALRAIRSTWP